MIRKFNEFFKEDVSFPNSKMEINKICNKYNIEDYKINDDWSIDVYDPCVYCDYCDNIPLKFNHVRDFSCINGRFKTLKGCPKHVDGNFWCQDGELTSLIEFPNYIDGYMNCRNNKLKSLEIKKNSEVGELLYEKNLPTCEIVDIFFTNNNKPSMRPIFHVGENMDLRNLLQEIFKAWNLYFPTYEKNGKLFVYDHRLREMYLDIKNVEFKGEFDFALYTVDKT